MNRIIHIDTQNMSATLEPYVDYGQLQAETMKRGLWNGGSPLATSLCKMASQFAFAGLWQTDLKYGLLNRNIVSVMDVVPTLLDLAGTKHPGSRYEGRAIFEPQGGSMLPMLLGHADNVHAADHWPPGS